MHQAIDITTPSTNGLLERIGEHLYAGFADEVVTAVKAALACGMAPYDVLTRGLVAGMDVVGVDFRDGVLFVPEVFMAARAMRAGLNVLRPPLAETGAPRRGTVVIGTVRGDIHDLGQRLVAMLLEGAGFDVVDIGVNNAVDDFLTAIDAHQPDILGMSALLTTTMPYMHRVVQALQNEGVRDDLIVLVGGAPLNPTFAEDIGADAYCRDASVAVTTARQLIEQRRKQRSEPIDYAQACTAHSRSDRLVEEELASA